MQRDRSAHNYILAIQFYLGNFHNTENDTVMHVHPHSQSASSLLALAQQTQEVANVRQSNELIGRFKNNLKELHWWIERALLQVQPFSGLCIRKLKVTNEVELNYYQIGKVFRFQNVISATLAKKADPEEVEDNRFDGANLVFLIHALNAKPARYFLPHDSPTEAIDFRTVLFRSGTEFLVCKREQRGSVLHVYLREVNLGLGKNVVLWCDDGTKETSFLKVHDWIRTKSYQDKESFQTQYVFKSQSLIAKAYCRSQFFILALQMSVKFRFIQNLTRKSENQIRLLQDHQEIEAKYTGWRLLRDFKLQCENLKGSGLLEKVEIANFVQGRISKMTPEDVTNTRKEFAESFGDQTDLTLDFRGREIKTLISDWRALAHFIFAFNEEKQFDPAYKADTKPPRP